MPHTGSQPCRCHLAHPGHAGTVGAVPAPQAPFIPLAHGDRDLGSLVTAGALGLEQNAMAGWIFSGGEMIWCEEGHYCELWVTSSGFMA